MNTVSNTEGRLNIHTSEYDIHQDGRMAGHAASWQDIHQVCNHNKAHWLDRLQSGDTVETE